MTVITGTIKNAAGELADGSFTVKANKIYGFNGAVIDGNEYTVDVLDGEFTTPDIAPGPVKLIADCGNWRKTFEKVLPDQETIDFWELVESTLIYEPEIVSTVVQARDDAQQAVVDAQSVLDQVEAGVVPDDVVSRAKLTGAVRDELDSKLEQAAVDARVTAVGNATYAPATGIVKTALASAVQTSLGKADTASQPADVTSAVSNRVIVKSRDFSALEGPQTVDQTGATDTATALQAALNAAAAVVVGTQKDVYNAGSTLNIAQDFYIPPGTYKINTPLTWPQGLNLKLSPGAIIKAGASMASLLTTSSTVIHQHETISGGVWDCNELATDGLDIRYFAHIVLDKLRVYSSAGGSALVLGKSDATNTPYGAQVRDLLTRKARNLTPAAGSSGIWMRNATDCEVIGADLMGHDIGILCDGSSNAFIGIHPWNATSITGPTACFRDNASNNRWIDCMADTPSAYGFDLNGSNTTIIGALGFLNGGSNDNTAVMFYVHGSPNVQSIGHYIYGANSSHRWAKDWGTASSSTTVNVTSIGYSDATTVVTRAFGTRSALRGLYVQGDPAVVPLQFTAGTVDAIQVFAPSGGGLGASVTKDALLRNRPVATGGRPTASAAGAGAQYFDTTLGKPVWSDGTNWKDAAGTTV